MNPMRQITIAGRTVGDGCPVYVIAEIGYNFNTIAEAKESVDAAAECGADAVKFQTFRAETITSRLTDFPAEAGGVNQFDEFRRYELSEEAHAEIFAHARKRGIPAFSTPSFYDDVDLLERVGVPAHKVGSDDLTNLPFHRYVASRGKPVVFSTGMSSLAEVAETFEEYWAAGHRQVAMLHCLSNYPVKDLSFVNLRAISTLRAAFPVPVGFSDHTSSIPAALGAIALGASILEKHFTLDKKLPAPDCFFSADPAEMRTLVRAVRELEQALGDGLKRPAPSEEKMRQETRKSTVARRRLRAGESIAKDDLIVKRPGTGVAPKLAHRLIGLRVRRDIAADQAITWEDVG